MEEWFLEQTARYGKEFPNGLKVDCYVHDILGFRYNWHNYMYELNIVIQGSMDFYLEGRKHRLEQDDVIIVNPNKGHASTLLEPDTKALVIHFSSKVFRPLLKEGQVLRFVFATDRDTRDALPFAVIRCFAAKLVRDMARPQSTMADAAALLDLMSLVSVLYSMCRPKVFDNKINTRREPFSGEMTEMIRFIEENVAGKLTLEDVAIRFGYNRTYLSHFFKKNLGTNFYEYLTNVRFQNAVLSMLSSGKTLTQIALESGFPDLKTFNKVFREKFQLSPAEYRRAYTGGFPEKGRQQFHHPEEPEVSTVLDRYTACFPAGMPCAQECDPLHGQ